jgi:fructan beta-fructosidase
VISSIDVATIELFADDGATVLTETFFPGEPFDRIRVYAEGGVGTLVRGEAHRLRNIWETEARR